MDHIIKNINLSVKYIVQLPYDGKDFHSFPERSGWELDEKGIWKRIGATEVLAGRENDGDLDAFLQSWLFFGVLVEVIGPSISVDDFIVENGHRVLCVTTEPLSDHIKSWASRIRERPSEHTGQLLKAQLILGKAYSLVSKHCAVANSDQKPLWNIDPLLALSFMVLGETLCHAIHKVVQSANITIKGWFEPLKSGWGYSESLLRSMRKDRWCPYSLHVLLGDLQQSTCGQLYASYLSYPKDLDLDHRRCSDYHCEARETGAHRQKHWETDDLCECDHIHVDLEKLTQILQRGKIPILKYRRGDQFVDIVEYNAGLSYAIISHVFTDGFANEHTNSLRSCHLEKFVQVFEKLSRIDQSLYFRQGSKELLAPIYFWIDALAIPIGHSYRDLQRKSVRNMHRMYRNAAFTIVFDAGLMAQERGGSYSETAMKITTSYWMTRLWTLQEACLSRRLLFVFSDALADMDGLEAIFKDDLTSPVPAAAQCYYFALLGPEREKLKQNVELLDSPQFLTSLWNALKRRKTKLSHHEPQAIATLLGLNTDLFDDIDFNSAGRQAETDLLVKRKMSKLMEMIAETSDRAIPAGLIFISSPRLPGKGFSWAPVSWLAIRGVELRYLSKPQRSGKLTSEGLEVTYPGFKLHRIAGAKTNGEAWNELCFTTDCSLQEWIVARADDIFEYSGPQVKQLAIITETLPVKRDRQMALIVDIVGTFGQTLHARILSTATVRAELESNRICELQKQLRSGLSNSFVAEVVDNDNFWCIDGYKSWQTQRNPRGTNIGLIERLGSIHLFSGLQSRFGFAGG